jgi:hypothetical protein
MQNNKRTLINLAVGEIVASLSFLFAFIMLTKILNLGIASMLAISFLIFLLIQGSFYWFIRYKSLRKRTPVPIRTISIFSLLRKINLVIILGTPIVVMRQYENFIDLFVASGIYLFALIEFINYYWYRLSYGKSGFNISILFRAGFKKSSLNKLIKKRKL